MRNLIWVLIGLTLVLAGTWFFKVPILIFEVPEAYRGWLVIDVERPDCPPVDRDGRTITMRFDAQGRLCIRDSLPSGFVKRKYFLVSPSSKKQIFWKDDDTSMIWGETGVGEQTFKGTTARRRFMSFFVGTKEEFEKAPLRLD